jgi:hypothetical protein
MCEPLASAVGLTFSALAASGLLASTVRAASGAGSALSAAAALGSSSCESSDAARRMSSGGLKDGHRTGSQMEFVGFIST